MITIRQITPTRVIITEDGYNQAHRAYISGMITYAVSLTVNGTETEADLRDRAWIACQRRKERAKGRKALAEFSRCYPADGSRVLDYGVIR